MSRPVFVGHRNTARFFTIGQRWPSPLCNAVARFRSLWTRLGYRALTDSFAIPPVPKIVWQSMRPEGNQQPFSSVISNFYMDEPRPRTRYFEDMPLVFLLIERCERMPGMRESNSIKYDELRFTFSPYFVL